MEIGDADRCRFFNEVGIVFGYAALNLSGHPNLHGIQPKTSRLRHGEEAYRPAAPSHCQADDIPKANETVSFPYAGHVLHRMARELRTS